jgi:hypothetical protein
VATLIGRLDAARARLTGRMPQLTAGTVEIFRHDWPVGSTEARRDLGFKLTPLDTGVAATLNALRTAAGRST